jgi:hypothetical protein
MAMVLLGKVLLNFSTYDRFLLQDFLSLATRVTGASPQIIYPQSVLCTTVQLPDRSL